jgi:hypothetical protein
LIEIGPIPSAASVDRRPRFTERHVLAIALATAGAFVMLALAAGIGGVVGGGSTWAALHLALAGAATVAIGAFMPHFAVTLAGTAPAPSVQRLASTALLGLGALGVVVGVQVVLPWVTAAGSGLLLLGLGVVAVHTITPSRRPLSRRHPIVTVTYVVALLELATGSLIGALGAVGVPGVLASWASIRPAHAWLTLFGAVSLTIVATLVYLGPTVLGARIRAGWGLALAVFGVGFGPVVASLGFVVDSRALVMTGAALTAAGGIGQLGYLIDTYRRRGRFTSEHDWRSVAIGHLAAGPVWLAAAATVAFIDLAAGRDLIGWSLGALALPMVAGWMLQELVGSWTHLVPSVTPADPAGHARQRRILAVASRTRLIAWNGGLAGAWIGVGIGAPWLAVAGGAVLDGAVLLSLGTMARALTLARY